MRDGQVFTETKEEYQRRAEQAKQLLTKHLGQQNEKQGQAASGK